jgi:3-phosphoshikimate 1-carboxyvinyltransferase
MRLRKKERPRLGGSVRVPGDKSISHRALILGALAEGNSRIENLNAGADVLATAAMLGGLGVRCQVRPRDSLAEVEGQGWTGLREPDDVLDAGNSGTTLRVLLGVAAAVPGLTVLTGDDSLRRRPMLRVVAPLRQLGATVDGRDHGNLAPLSVRGGELVGADVELPVASAQVKTAVLLAGLSARGETTVREPSPSRDHTERMLHALGVSLEMEPGRVSLSGGQRVEPFTASVPGDISSAMFLLAAAAMAPGSELEVTDVGLNPTRTGALEVMRRMGAGVRWEQTASVLGEPVGRVCVTHAGLTATLVEGEEVPTLIDDIPALALVATQAEGETVFREASELRVKESDRIATLATGLRSLGADVEESPDGLVVRGPTPLHGGEVDSKGDHRMAMAFAIAGVVADERVRVLGWSSVETSFPEFLDVLAEARA